MGGALAGSVEASVVEGEGLLVQFSSLGVESEMRCVARGFGFIRLGQRGGA